MQLAIAVLSIWGGLSGGAEPKAAPVEKQGQPQIAGYLDLKNPLRPGAIVPEQLGKDFATSETKVGEVTGHFTLTKEQIDTFEGGLLAWLLGKKAQSLDRVKDLAVRLAKERRGYRAQYVGLLSGKKRILHANFFLDPKGEKFKDWLTQPILVEDGGNSFFYVEYDVDEKDYLFIMVNGEA